MKAAFLLSEAVMWKKGAHHDRQLVLHTHEMRWQVGMHFFITTVDKFGECMEEKGDSLL